MNVPISPVVTSRRDRSIGFIDRQNRKYHFVNKAYTRLNFHTTCRKRLEGRSEDKERIAE
jgi:hypothetical protein